MIHPWLEKYPIKKDSKYLIIGTHPPMPYCGKLEFYYGNMGEFWRLLNQVYPNHNLFNNSCPLLENIIQWMDKYEIWITDIVYKTVVENFSTDKQMGKILTEYLNPCLKNWLQDYNTIEKIYFTSFAGKNNAYSLFRKWYKINYGKILKPIQSNPEFYQIG